MKTKAILAFALASVASAAGAHELFLKPVRYYAAPGSTVQVELFNGTYSRSENAVARERMADASVVMDGKRTPIDAGQWADGKQFSVAMLKLAEPGSYTVGLSTRPRVITLAAADFDRYLREEGIEDVAAERKRQNAPAAPVTERYSKHVRAVVQVGQTLTNDPSRPLGYPTELLLLSHPATLKAGDALTFQALYKGEPLPGQLVYASREGFHAHGPDGAHVNRIRTRTGADGKAAIRIDRAGKWYLTMIYLRKVDEAEVEYESNWSTVTFGVR